MQESARSGPEGALSKPILLGLVTLLVIGVVTPLVLPHLSHPSMIYHIVLHVASVVIGVFLSIVSLLAYSRSRTHRLLFMTLAFMALALVEFLYLLDSSGISDFSIEGIDLTHIILLGMLTLFGFGVLKVNK